MATTPTPWQVDRVGSVDGTRVAVLAVGEGPGLVVVPGNNRRAHHYERLALALSGRYRVHVVERRGRGASGAQGTHYSVDREVEDVLAVLTATGARYLFGHSYGGLVALHVALRTDLAALAVYEPAVSIAGSFSAGWLPRFTTLVGQDRHVAAMTLFLRHTRLAPIGAAPAWVFHLLAYLLLHGAGGADTRAMLPTTPPELS